jgi:hypothetical protein
MALADTTTHLDITNCASKNLYYLLFFHPFCTITIQFA